MRKPLILSLIFIFGMVLKVAWSSDDNLLAVDIPGQKKENPAQESKVLKPEQSQGKSASLVSGQELPQEDEFNKDLKKIKAFHELMNDRRHTIEMIKLDLEKNDLLLKEKQAQKQIYEIEKVLPEARKEESQKGAPANGLNPSLVDPADVKIAMLLVAEGLKEGILTLKGTTYGFKEGDCVASKLTVSKITSDTVTFKQTDGTEFKLNFMD